MSAPKWQVIKVKPSSDFKLTLKFADGKTGIFDFNPFLKCDYYASLGNLPLFMTARIECGTVVWGDDLDIAPELLYENAKNI